MLMPTKQRREEPKEKDIASNIFASALCFHDLQFPYNLDKLTQRYGHG